MNIAYCTATFPCASETFLLRELSYLRGCGVNITVWSLASPAGGAAHVTGDGTVRVVRRPARFSMDAVRSLAWLVCCRPRRLLVLLGEALRLLPRSVHLAMSFLANLHAVAWFARDGNRNRITLIHGCFLNLPGLVAMAAAFVEGLPFSVAGHARDVFVESGAVRTLARRAACVVVCHESAARAIQSRLNDGTRSRVHVIRHGLAHRDVSPAPAGNGAGAPGEPTIAAAGRFVPKKGFDCLIRACALLANRGERFRLVLAGHGPLAESLRTLVGKTGIADRTTLPGWLSTDALRRLLRRACVVVVPSVIAGDGDRDGVPNVVLEAWGAGTPVVASALPGLCEAIVHEEHGLLVEPWDAVGLADALRRVLGDPGLRQRLADQGRHRLRDEFDLETNGQRLLELFARMHYDGLRA